MDQPVRPTAPDSSNGDLAEFVANSARRAQLYHFFELALAHPGEAGHDYFRLEATEAEFTSAYGAALEAESALGEKGKQAAANFFSGMRRMGYEEAEAAYISLFTNNYPHLPCPPYGSLFTAIDSEKRLEEMLAIKEFYQRHGMDIAESYDDLPDHLCVELEFMQLLSFRESEAIAARDKQLANGVREAEGEFLDRFLLPFLTRLAELATGTVPDNPYSELLEAGRCLLIAHRKELGEPAEPKQAN